MKLFAYGTLMDPDIMRRVSGFRVQGMPGVLHGYQRRRILHQDYPGIIAARSASVDGVLYPGVSRQMLHRLDIFEGDMYLRQRVFVWAEQRLTEAHVYVLRDRYRTVLSDEPWSFVRFSGHGRARFLSEYLGFDWLNDTAAGDDSSG